MLVLTGIGTLVTNDVTLERGKLGVINNAALVVGDDNKVALTCEAVNLPRELRTNAVDIGGRAVIARV